MVERGNYIHQVMKRDSRLVVFGLDALRKGDTGDWRMGLALVIGYPSQIKPTTGGHLDPIHSYGRLP